MATYDARMLSFSAFPEIIIAKKKVTFYAAYNSKAISVNQLEEILQTFYCPTFYVYKTAELIDNTIIRNYRI